MCRAVNRLSYPLHTSFLVRALRDHVSKDLVADIPCQRSLAICSQIDIQVPQYSTVVLYSCVQWYGKRGGHGNLRRGGFDALCPHQTWLALGWLVVGTFLIT
jgi:hypothetical protein